jgi:hypothetical protein
VPQLDQPKPERGGEERPSHHQRGTDAGQTEEERDLGADRAPPGCLEANARDDGPRDE